MFYFLDVLLIWCLSVFYRGDSNYLNPPPYIEVSLLSQKSERSCICMSRVFVLPISTIFLLDIRIVQTVRYFVFILLHDCKHSFKWNLKCFRSSIFMFRTSWFICSQRLVTFNVLHVPIFWLWTYLMMVISETHHVH